MARSSLGVRANWKSGCFGCCSNRSARRRKTRSGDMAGLNEGMEQLLEPPLLAGLARCTQFSQETRIRLTQSPAKLLSDKREHFGVRHLVTLRHFSGGLFA